MDQDVKTVQFSESNSKFLLGTSKGQVVEWDWEDGKTGKVLDALEIRIGRCKRSFIVVEDAIFKMADFVDWILCELLPYASST